MNSYFIGVDLGTTSTKAVLFDAKGKTVSKAEKEYCIYSPEMTFREQKPDEILNAVFQTLNVCIKTANINTEHIGFVSFSSAMHSLIAVDFDGKPLTDCIIWADTRSSSYAEEFRKTGKGLDIYRRTGTPIHPMSPLYKLMWLRDNRPNIFNSTYKFISIKEYVFEKLFGEYIVDYSIASATGIFDIFKLEWDSEALGILGIDKERLSRPVPTTYSTKCSDWSFCEATGLKENTVFIIGASDGCLANLGSNAIKKGTAAVTIGTSGAVRVVFDKPVTDSKGRVFCYILTEDKYVVGGPINNGGIIYRWFRDNFMPVGSKYDELNEYVSSTEPGSNGLLFLPFLIGERAPYWDADLRGAFLGLSDMHRKNHFARAVIEGICFDMNDVLEAVREQVGGIDMVMANGGFTVFEEWVQILADTMGRSITVQENTESACLGAVMLGFLATGMVGSLEECSNMIMSTRVFEPQEEKRRIYSELFLIYKQAITDMIPILKRLAGFQKDHCN